MASSKKLLKNSTSLRRKTKSDSGSALHSLSLLLHAFLNENLKLNNSTSADLKPTLLLALSGGLDSMVLLHLLAAARAHLSYNLHAMHVHHGLSPNADIWAAFCQAHCENFNVPLQIKYVHVAQNPDYKNSIQGIEAEARQLRYDALFGYALVNNMPVWVVTAHHQDDQAETLLLQLFRGAGVRGLSSMAAVDKTRRLIRPLLNVPRQALLDYALQHGMTWCDDESNDNTQYDRNFVRHQVMPVLESRFNSLNSVLARTAAHMAEANELLQTLAIQDAATLLSQDSICLQGLAQLSTARIKNVLRWWFDSRGLAMPAADHLQEIVEQLLHSGDDADLNIKLQHLYLRKFRKKAYLCEDKPLQPYDLVWNGEPELTLPGGGRLLFKQVTGRGLAVGLGIQKLRICLRSGGERFKPDAQRPTRTLKYLLQSLDMPPWKRQHLPLVYWDDKLAFVPGVGVACDLKAHANEAGLEIIWEDQTP